MINTEYLNLSTFVVNKEYYAKANEEVYLLEHITKKNFNVTLHLNSKASLKLVVLCSPSTESITIKAFLKQDAKLSIYNVILTDHDMQIKQNVDLQEQGSSLNIMNVFLATSTSNLLSSVNITHEEKSTTSVLENYAISQGEAFITIDNSATLKKGVSKSNAKQITKGLTNSTTSKIKALPNLYIDEYDVLASHACSIGSLNSEDLFYLMSRGLTKNEAANMMVMGFIQPLLDEINNKSIQNKVLKAFTKYLNN